MLSLFPELTIACRPQKHCSIFPTDTEALKARLSSLLLERDEQKRRADEFAQRALIQESLRQSLELKVEQLQQELELLKKRYYGPRADRLRSMAELGQLLLSFSEELAAKPVNAGDVEVNANPAQPERELRWVRRRKGRRNLAAFENLPVQTIVHELSAEQRVCGCCGSTPARVAIAKEWVLRSKWPKSPHRRLRKAWLDRACWPTS